MLLALTVAAALGRVELPITEVVLSDGTRRYTAPLAVAGRSVTAGLDTGSVGLRLLPAATAGTTSTGQAESYSYGVGTQLDGVVAGLVTYFAGDVLYDADRATIAVRSRPPYLDGAVAR